MNVDEDELNKERGLKKWLEKVNMKNLRMGNKRKRGEIIENEENIEEMKNDGVSEMVEKIEIISDEIEIKEEDEIWRKMDRSKRIIDLMRDEKRKIRKWGRKLRMKKIGDVVKSKKIGVIIGLGIIES